MGGFFTSKEYNDPKDDPERIKRAYAICWGKVVVEPTERAIEARHVKVAVKYGPKKHMLLEAWGWTGAAQVISNLKNGDMVLCFGQFVRRLADRKKKGTTEWMYSIQADIVLTAEMMAHLGKLGNSKWLNRRLEWEDNATADDWEADYHEE